MLVKQLVFRATALRIPSDVQPRHPRLPHPTLLGHSAFALGMALLPHLEGLFQASAWYDGSTSTAMVKEI